MRILNAFNVGIALAAAAIPRAAAATAGSLALETQAASKIDTAAAKEQSKDNLFAVQQKTYHTILAKSLTHVADNACVLQNMRNVKNGVRQHEKGVLQALTAGVHGLYFNPYFTPQSARRAFMSQLCRNAQLTPALFGQKWWDDVSAAGKPCFEDTPDRFGQLPSRLAFANPDTILQAKLLVPPSPDAMYQLNNPDDPASDPEATWRGLNTAERRFVSAVRYVQSNAISIMKQNTFYADRASLPQNMPLMVRNLSALAKLNLLMYIGYEEVAYRTAPDADALAAIPEMKAVSANGAFVKQYLQNQNVGLQEFRPLDDSNDPVDKTYMSRALLEYAMGKVYPRDAKNFLDNAKNFGKDDGKIAVANGYQEIEAEYDELMTMRDETFRTAMSYVNMVKGDFVTEGVDAPVRRADADAVEGAVKKVGLRSGARKKPMTMSLEEMLRAPVLPGE